MRCLRGRVDGQLERVAHAALDAHAGVRAALGGDLVRRALAQHAALADVRALGVLADDDEVVAGAASERPLVDVQVELEAHLQQQAPLDHARAAPPACRRRRAGWRRSRAARRASRRTGSRRRAGSAGRRGRTRSVSMSTPAARRTLTASAVTSGPMPSPPITAMRCVVPSAMARQASEAGARPLQTLGRGRRRPHPRSARTPPVASSDHGSEPALPARPSTGCRPSSRTSPPGAASRWPTRSSGPASSATSPRTATTTPPRTSRATWRVASASSSRSSRTPRSSRPPEPGVVGPGTIVTIVYEGDSDDDAERYLVGHIEEQTDDLDGRQPDGAARRRAASAAARGDTVAYETPTGAAAAGPASSRWRRPDRAGHRAHRSTPSWRRSTTLDDAPRRRRPPLPPGREVELPAGHGAACASCPGRPARRPSCCCTAGRRRPTSTSHTCYDALGEHFRVLAFDHRGHGRGHPHAAPVPPRGLRRRRRRDGRRRRRRPVRRRRLLDGRRGRPAAVAPPPRARARASCWRPPRRSFNARRNERLSFLGLTRPRPRSPG